jgi:tRNA(adenine34) deaminase
MDEQYMREALNLARMASSADEVPVGALIVLNGEIIAGAGNSPIASNDPTGHAEINAIRQAALRVDNYRLENADLFCTLEPCAMCAGAIVHARIRRLIFGARDLRFGGVRSKFRIADSDLLNHRVEIIEGVMGAECAELLQTFFSSRRH